MKWFDAKHRMQRPKVSTNYHALILSVARKEAKALSGIKFGLSRQEANNLLMIGLLLSAPEGVEEVVPFGYLVSHVTNLTEHRSAFDMPSLSLLDNDRYPQKQLVQPLQILLHGSVLTALVEHEGYGSAGKIPKNCRSKRLHCEA